LFKSFVRADRDCDGWVVVVSGVVQRAKGSHTVHNGTNDLVNPAGACGISGGEPGSESRSEVLLDGLESAPRRNRLAESCSPYRPGNPAIGAPASAIDSRFEVVRVVWRTS